MRFRARSTAQRRKLAESADASAPGNTNDSSAPSTAQPTPAPATGPSVDAFHEAFDDRSIGYLQHQRAILGSSLGEDNARIMKLIIRSLKLWKRAVTWLERLSAGHHPLLEEKSPFDRDLRIALVDQTNIWQAPVLGEESLEAFTTPGLANGMRMKVAKLLATAITPQQIGDLERTVVADAQAVLKPLQAEVVSEIKTISSTIGTPLVTLGDNLLRKSLPIVLVVGCAVAVLLLMSGAGCPVHRQPGADGP
jgi:hypothetical protein